LLCQCGPADRAISSLTHVLASEGEILVKS
jgi:hypothetical protein